MSSPAPDPKISKRKISVTVSTTPFPPFASNNNNSHPHIHHYANAVSIDQQHHHHESPTTTKRRLIRERDPLERFPLLILFADSGETVKIPGVSKFWTVGDVSRRTVRIRKELQEQKMGLPGVYFPTDQERIVMKYKDKERLCTLSSMESALKSKFFYSPARDDGEISDEENEVRLLQREEEQARDFDQVDEGDDEFWKQRAKETVGPHNFVSPSPDRIRRINHPSTSRQRRHGNRNHDNNNVVKFDDSEDDDDNTEHDEKTNDKKYEKFEKFHHASDFRNEFDAQKLQHGTVGNSHGGNTGRGAAKNSSGNNSRISGSSLRTGGLRCEIRLSRQGQYFNDPHQSMEDLGITYDASLFHERNGSCLQLEAEVVQQLIFGRALLKRI